MREAGIQSDARASARRQVILSAKTKAAPKARAKKAGVIKCAPVADAYSAFIIGKTQLGGDSGFAPLWMPDFLMGFQSALVEWNIRKGRSAMFADCGLGKTIMQLVWAQNVIQKTNRPVLILTPLAVAAQTVREGEKFGIEVTKCGDGNFGAAKCVVTNYERLHHFNRADFAGVVADESSILKNFDGVTRAAVTEFMRMLQYRLLCTATAAPNDYIELGTSSEALGVMGYMDMLGKFFKTADGSGGAHGGAGRIFHQPGKRANPMGGKFRFRGHGEHDFWRWVCSWARAVRKPSDIGFDDGDFTLPTMTVTQHVIHARTRADGYLIDMPAHGLSEQRAERRRTVQERCEKVAELVNATGRPAVSWCNLNDEGDLLAHLIPDATQVSGTDSDEEKEEAFEAFTKGEIRVLISKAVIAGLGLNWQHCAHQTWFPSHSFEQFYQGSRRSWRFGQKQPVQIDVITSDGEANVLANLQRKTEAAAVMFSKLVELMNNELHIHKPNPFTKTQNIPLWLIN